MKKINDVLVLTVGRVLIMLTSVVSLRIFTTILSPSEAGRFNILLSSYGWFGLVLISPIGTYFNRKIIEWDMEGSVKRYLRLLLIYYIIIAFLASIVVVVVKNTVGIGIQVSSLWIVIVMFGSVLFTSGNMLILSWLNFFGKRVSFVLLSIMTLWISMGLSVCFVSRISPVAELWLLGQLIAQATIMTFGVIILLKTVKSNEHAGKVNEPVPYGSIYSFCWPVAVGTLLYWFQSQGYRFIYQRMAGIELLGLFAVGFGLGSSLMLAFETLFTQYYHPIFYREIAHGSEENKTAAWNKFASAFIPSIIIMVMYVSMNSFLIAKIFTSAQFYKAGYIVMWGALAESLRITSSTISMVSIAQNNLKPLIAPGITMVIVSLGGVYLLAGVSPFTGVGCILAVSWLFSLSHSYRNMKRLLPVHISWKRMLYALGIGLPFGAFCIVTYKMFPHPSILQACLSLAISGTYMGFAQYVLARKWIKLPIELPIVDAFETKIKYFFYPEGM